MKNKKQAAPKRDENLKVKQQAYTRLDAPKPSMNKESEEDRAIEAKAMKKAEKQAAKSEKRMAKVEKHPLHFHPLRFIFHLLIFIIATIALFVGTLVLFFNGETFTIMSVTFTIPELAGTVIFYIGLAIMVLFAIWMAEFQLGFRRVFRIGRHERVRAAIAKQQAKEDKKAKRRA